MRIHLNIAIAGMAGAMICTALGTDIKEPTRIPVTDKNVAAGLSPYNWVCTNDFLGTAVCGASLTVGFHGTSQVALQLDTSNYGDPKAMLPSSCPILAWSVNGGPIQSCQLSSATQQVILATGIADPTLDLYVKGMSPFGDRFNGEAPRNSVKITGFMVDAGGTTAPVQLPQKIWLNIGDSILSGDGAALTANAGRPKNDRWAEAGDGRKSYGYLLAQHYGYREARLAYGGYNWAGGLGRIPAIQKLMDQRTSTVRRFPGETLTPPPDVVLVNLGENGVAPENHVVSGLTHIRHRIGSQAQLLLMIPVSGKGRAEITRSFQTYQAASKDDRAHLIDPGPIQFATCDRQHPVAAGHQAIFKAALPAFDAILTNSFR